MDVVFLVDMAKDDSRIEALRRVVLILPVDQTGILWDKSGTLNSLKLMFTRLKVFHSLNSGQ